MSIIANQTKAAAKKRRKPNTTFDKSKRTVMPDSMARHYDYKLLITIMMLCAIGLIMIYSSSAYTASRSASTGKDQFYFLKREAELMAVGFAAMLFISKFIDYHFFMLWPIRFLTVAVTMFYMVSTVFIWGVSVNGQKRWSYFIPFIKKGPTFQPSELVKVSIILIFAFLINKHIKRIDRWKTRILLIGWMAFLAGLVFAGNLSAGIICVGIGLVMYYIASKNIPFFALGAGSVAVVYGIVYSNPQILLKILKDYQYKRVAIWRNPASDPLGDGYQILQGLYAIGSGGWFGKGLGNSVQKLSFIPESYNDMIFAIICEELGIFGAACVIGLFVFLIYRCWKIIEKAPDLYGAMLVSGVMIQIALQLIFNVGVVTNMIPNTGITLPFISYGGTAVAILLVEMGIVLSVSNGIKYTK